jgi:hypothetical protein
MFSSTNPEVTGVSDTAIASLSDGRMRMYFSSEKGSEWFQDIRSAISTDGLNWEIEQGIRISADQPGYRSVANNPTVIKVPGGWRIYFRGSDIAPLWSQIYSAFSPDGLDFNVEGIRLSYRRFGFERHGVAFPHVTKIPGGGFRMYYTGYWGLLFDHKVVAYYIERGKELGLSGSH